MEKWAEIRRLVKVEKRSKRSVRRQFGIHWDTLAKILEHAATVGAAWLTQRQNDGWPLFARRNRYLWSERFCGMMFGAGLSRSHVSM